MNLTSGMRHRGQPMRTNSARSRAATHQHGQTEHPEHGAQARSGSSTAPKRSPGPLRLAHRGHDFTCRLPSAGLPGW